MDGFKNTTRMKYMCGGPVRKATGGMIKSAAPKSVAKSAAAGTKMGVMASDLIKKGASPTPPKSVAKASDLGSKRFIDQTRPEPVREAPRPTMEPKRQVQPTPPKDVGREFPRPTMEPKRLIAQTPPDDVRTIGGAPKGAKTLGSLSLAAKTMGGAPKGAKTMGGAPKLAKAMGGAIKGAKTMGSVSPAAKTMGSVSPAAKTMGSVSPGAKTMGNAPKAMKGVPVASKKPMIGQFKTGGYVSKSTFKW